MNEQRGVQGPGELQRKGQHNTDNGRCHDRSWPVTPVTKSEQHRRYNDPPAGPVLLKQQKRRRAKHQLFTKRNQGHSYDCIGNHKYPSKIRERPLPSAASCVLAIPKASPLIPTPNTDQQNIEKGSGAANNGISGRRTRKGTRNAMINAKRIVQSLKSQMLPGNPRAKSFRKNIAMPAIMAPPSPR